MSNRPRVLIAEPEAFSRDAISELEAVADVDARVIGQNEMAEALALYDAVWIRLHLKVGRGDIPTAPACRFVVTATTGIDHLDVGAMDASGISCLSLRGHDDFLKTVTSTADLAMGLILAVVRRIPQAADSVKSGQWQRDRFVGRELSALTLGLVGYGRLGRAVAGYASAFGMSVCWYDPYVKSDDAGRETELTGLLRRSDVVSIHVKLSDGTRGMCGAEFFAGMKRGSYFINTSRAALVDEQAFLLALRDGTLAGAASDVISGEPCVDITHPLIAFARTSDRLIITPHIGGASSDAMRRCEDYLAHELRKRLE